MPTITTEAISAGIDPAMAVALFAAFEGLDDREEVTA